MHKIVVVLTETEEESLYKQMQKASVHADLFELRLDFFPSLKRALSVLKWVQKRSSIPFIATVRTIHQGGRADLKADAYFSILQEIALQEVSYVDIESWVPWEEHQKLVQMFPDIFWIVSYHGSLPAQVLYDSLLKRSAYAYKIALDVSDDVESLSSAFFAAEKKERLCVMGTGPSGKISRILSKRCGSNFTYTSVRGDFSGHVSLHDLVYIYNLPSHGIRTRVYGLIGDPVSESISPYTHNALCKRFGIDGIYVPMQIKEALLPKIIPLIRNLPFQGISVTMPLKKAIIPFLDEVDTSVVSSSINTIFNHSGRLIGYNTDGIGAICALEKHTNLFSKRCCILGSGGAACAIAHELLRNGCFVIIASRNQDTGKKLAAAVGGEYVCVEKKLPPYDILINATPSLMPVSQEAIFPKTVVMDLHTQPLYSDFLRFACSKGCTIVFGYEMFIEQASLQWFLWEKELATLEEYRNFLHKKAKEFFHGDVNSRCLQMRSENLSKIFSTGG